MNVDFAIDLMRWFATAEPTELDYRDQGIRLVLKKDGVPVEPVAHVARIEGTDNVQRQATSVAPDVTGVKAPATGRFVHQHPLDSPPLAMAGRNVEAGDIVGYLQIGDALSAVEAPFAGEISEITKPNEALVGYGETLMTLVANRAR